jgi:hypothetical protein
MTTFSSQSRLRLAKALGAWGENIEATARLRVGLIDRPKGMSEDTAGSIATQILVELVTTVTALSITVLESTPDRVGTDIQARALAKTVLDLIATKADVLSRNVVQREVDVAKFTQNLMNHPQVAATAREFGARTPAEIREYVRPIAVKTAENLRQLIEAAVPIVLDVAREPASVSVLETQFHLGLQHRPWWQFWT